MNSTRDDGNLNMQFAHGLCAKLIPVCGCVNKLQIPQLRCGIEEKRVEPVNSAAYRSPGDAFQLMGSRNGRYVDKPVSIELVSSITVLMVH